MNQSPHGITQLLTESRNGDRAARARLTKLVYDELKRIANVQMRRERGANTLQATALVNEAYLELFSGKLPDFNDRTHFFAYAATVMRHILVHSARRRQALKRGGGLLQVTLNDLPDPQKDHQLLDLDAALDRLAAVDERKARIVELRFFGGLSIEEIGTVADLAPSTVHRELHAARGWLFRTLSECTP